MELSSLVTAMMVFGTFCAVRAIKTKLEIPWLNIAGGIYSLCLVLGVLAAGGLPDAPWGAGPFYTLALGFTAILAILGYMAVRTWRTLRTRPEWREFNPERKWMTAAWPFRASSRSIKIIGWCRSSMSRPSPQNRGEAKAVVEGRFHPGPMPVAPGSESSIGREASSRGERDEMQRRGGGMQKMLVRSPIQHLL